MVVQEVARRGEEGREASSPEGVYMTLLSGIGVLPPAVDPPFKGFYLVSHFVDEAE